MSESHSVDFHCHSNLSDGLCSPRGVARDLVAASVDCAALTDHDTLAGLEKFERVMHQNGIATLTGVEITIDDPLWGCHLLAYGFDRNHPPLNSLLSDIRARRCHGFTMLARDLHSVWCRYILRHPPVHRNTLDLKEIIEVVHSAGGLAFLAHPFLLTHNLNELSTQIAKLKEIGLDGIEAFYKAYPLERQEQLAELASTHQLLVSAGSDSHGAHMPRSPGPGMEMEFHHWCRFRDALGKRIKQPSRKNH